MNSRANGVLCATLLTAGVMVSAPALAILVTTTNDANTLVSTIVGTGITVNAGSISYTGGAVAAGTFTDGNASGIGIDKGVVLTSGNAALIDNVNDQDGAGLDIGLPGDADLNALIPGFSTNDATILSFDFTSDTGDLFFNYVFGSEEYNEFVSTQFNDVFAFFLDGANIAIAPDGNPVSINNVNCGNPYVGAGPNCDYFNNNDLTDGGPFFAFEYDGFTDVFTASFLDLAAGNHSIKLAIADAGDFVLDSGVFIQAGTFSGEPTPAPEPGTLALFSIGLAGLGWRVRRRKAEL